jgi:hypothetical protein
MRLRNWKGLRMANSVTLPAPRKATTAFVVIVPALAFFVLVAAQLPALHHLVPALQGFWSDRPGEMEVAPHAWISLFVVAVLNVLPGIWNLHAALIMVSSLGAAFSLGLLFKAMQSDRWRVWEAVLLLALVAAQPLVIYLTVNANESIPFALAFGMLVYAANRLDVNGDVQSQMTFGLFLPLLALVRPEVAVFIPVLAFLVPLRDRAARRDIRAFTALFLVSILRPFWSCSASTVWFRALKRARWSSCGSSLILFPHWPRRLEIWSRRSFIPCCI